MSGNRRELLLKRFAAAARAHHEAVEAMNEARANAHARKIAALHQALRVEGAPGLDGMLALVDDESPEVAGMAAVYVLHLHPDRCLAVLRRIAAEPGLLGFRAGVAVERWETGEWTPPGA
jgi:hypothetical protein